MKKRVILSLLAALVFASSVEADRWEGRHIKRHNHQINHIKRVDRHYIRPHRRVIHRPFRRPMVRRPHYVTLGHRLGHRIHRLHRNSFALSVGGLGYHYSGGAFYRPYRSGFRVVNAPIGAIVHTLPVGYVNLHINNQNYYRYEDTYYEPRGRGYCVVEAPTRCETASNNYDTNYQYQIGDIALNLPSGAVEVIVDGRSYYEADGQYFLRAFRDGKNVYEVVRI
jgi:hypothetical protein